MSVDPSIVLATVGLIFTIAGGGWALMKAFGYLMNRVVEQFKEQLDERFAAQERARDEGRKVWEDRMAKLDEKQERMDRELRKLLIDLPDKFIRREDYVRRETVIESKIDQLSLRIQNWMLEERHHD